MIEIRYDLLHLMIEAEGHAGYAQTGKDIVCAGVSALMMTLPAFFDMAGAEYTLETEKESGRFYLRCSGRGYPVTESYRALKLVVCGLYQIAEQYPDYVKIRKTDIGQEGMNDVDYDQIQW